MQKREITLGSAHLEIINCKNHLTLLKEYDNNMMEEVLMVEEVAVEEIEKSKVDLTQVFYFVLKIYIR